MSSSLVDHFSKFPLLHIISFPHFVLDTLLNLALKRLFLFEQEEALKRKVKKRIKDEMWERDDMKQWELAEMINEGTAQTNRAINGLVPTFRP